MSAPRDTAAKVNAEMERVRAEAAAEPAPCVICERPATLYGLLCAPCRREVDERHEGREYR